MSSADCTESDGGEGVGSGDPVRHSRDQLLVRSRVFLQAWAPVVVEDVDGVVLDLNQEAVEAYGWSRDELVGAKVDEIIAPECREQAAVVREHCRRGRRLDHVEWIRVTRAGERVPTLLTQFPIQDERGEVAAIASVATDISELKRRDMMRRELLRAEERAEERERAELSRDLHDSVGQLLALASIRLAATAEHAGAGELGRRIREILSLVRDAETQTRTLLFRVRSAAFEESGLVGGIEQLAEWIRDRYGVEVELDVDVELPGPDQAIARALFRGARELLINVARHAGTGRARLRIEVGGDDVRLVVEDDGRGFDPTRQELGPGLFGVRDRMEAVGGSCEIDAAPGRGTRVVLHAPQAGAAETGAAETGPWEGGA